MIPVRMSHVLLAAVAGTDLIVPATHAVASRLGRRLANRCPGARARGSAAKINRSEGPTFGVVSSRRHRRPACVARRPAGPRRRCRPRSICQPAQTSWIASYTLRDFPIDEPPTTTTSPPLSAAARGPGGSGRRRASPRSASHGASATGPTTRFGAGRAAPPAPPRRAEPTTRSVRPRWQRRDLPPVQVTDCPPRACSRCR